MKILILLISTFIVGACQVNPSDSEGVGFDLKIKTITSINTRIVEYSTMGEFPSKYEVMIPLCLVDPYMPEEIVQGEFEVQSESQRSFLKADFEGCLNYSFFILNEEFDLNQQIKKTIHIQAKEYGGQKKTIQLSIYRQGIDLLVKHENAFDQQDDVNMRRADFDIPTHENFQFDIKKLSNFSFESQSYRVKKSLELMVSRKVNVTMDVLGLVRTLKNNQISENLAQGDGRLRLAVFNSEFRRTHFLEDLLLCNHKCIVAQGESSVKIENGVIDEVLQMDYFFHDLSKIRNNNIFIMELMPKGSSTARSFFVGQIDFLNPVNKQINVKKIKFSKNHELFFDRALKLHQALLSQHLEIVPERILTEEIMSSKINEKVNTLFDEDLSDLSYSAKYNICGELYDGVSFFKCILGVEVYLKIKSFRLMNSVHEAEIVPFNQWSYNIQFTTVNLHEKRYDEGYTHGWRFEEGVFEEGKITTSTGLKILGNGATLEGEVGIKAEQKRFDIQYESEIDSVRYRSQKAQSIEFMVDELEFDLDVDVSHCIMVYAIQRSKKIYYCKNNEKQDSYRESYFYIRPIRNVNSANSFIDGGLYTSLLSKTFFGRYEYEQFVEALEMKYLVFVRSKEEFETLKSAKEVFETKYQMPMYVEGGN